LKEVGVWEPNALTSSLNDFLVSHPRAVHPRILVHCNYLTTDAPFAPTHSVVYCPRTHAAFGHPPHPFREFLNRGVRVCLGTDSLASNPDLDILAEARFVHAKYPDFPGDQLLKMVTLSGAEALGWADECGILEPRKSADLVAVPLPDCDGDPFELLFSGELATAPRQTMFRGEWRL
jgi:cytosine/adenosine deaminase-related metal-dependent hydrolase